MKTKSSQTRVADIFKVLGAPFRIELLLCIGNGEACVCHLEAHLDKRQAYISQHLMVLRDAGILKTRRDGKYIFYRIADLKILELIESAGNTMNIPTEAYTQISESRKQDNCVCPMCNTEQ